MLGMATSTELKRSYRIHGFRSFDKQPLRSANGGLCTRRSSFPRREKRARFLVHEQGVWHVVQVGMVDDRTIIRQYLQASYIAVALQWLLQR